MAIYTLEDDISEGNKMLRGKLLHMAYCEGGQRTEIVDIPFPDDVTGIVKDCFKIKNFPDGLHREHFRSEIIHHYDIHGYKRIRGEDKEILWFEKNSLRNAVDVHYSPLKKELILVVMEYDKSAK